MLKRQRPVSPPPPPFVPDLSLPPDPYLMGIAAQRDTKRRRTAAPALDGSLRGWGVPLASTDDEDEDLYEGEEEEKGYVRDNTAGEGADGGYKSANSFLHDLHAEHQHRLIFASPPPHSPHHRRHPHPHPDSGTPGKSVMTMPHPKDSRHVPREQTQSDGSLREMEEVQRIRNTYENRNRMLGELFLSRRRALSSTPDE